MITKYRAWIKKQDYIGEVTNIDFETKTLVTWNSNNGVCQHTFDEAVLLPFTGFKDLNGNDIYQGDILISRFRSSTCSFLERHVRKI